MYIYKYYYIQVLLFIPLFCCQFGYSQDTIYNSSKKEQVKIGQLLKHDFKYTIKSVSHSFTRPIHWKRKDFEKLGAILIGTAALSTLDNETNRFFNKNEKGFPKPVRDFGWYFGSPQNYFMANAGLYGFGLFTKNEKIRKTSVLIISSSITTGFIQTILKNGVGRARPNSGFDSLDFEPFSSKPSHHSFPSGHTILSITMAHAIAKQFDNTWAKIGIYSIGAIPPISRLVDGAHWLTDIAFSTALSVIIVNSIDKFLFNSNYSTIKKSKKISWNLNLSNNQIGVIGFF
ncbi:phosphatase PAP2 family protein [Hyunsoonleella pacifica]|uniref:Phosphatase PAP2 family protein n=1 Tax=Hyunsoonleella pacifica TaxID=1080224 RepID=A0A4Q9FWJ7_9FLAO|nr:phosphatase PAP2 family protein [Hyunsoonleella pacifica]TBN18915.1 phosphatase PAP2 family protein [Hyunsoonleella pacifica]GGD05852.1 hypothetical protein GCM10011368_04560 [Hyunsoonleella pacifica]